MHHTVVNVVVPVVAKLSLPVKVCRGGDLIFNHFGDHVTRVDVNCDHGAEHHSNELWKDTADQFGQVVQGLKADEC